MSEDATGAMDFTLWRGIGKDFLVKSNINNWISCSEDGGSFVTQTDGGLKCKVERNIVPELCEQVSPYRLIMDGRGPALFASGFYYYFETSETQSWPVADPCGTTQSTNHLEEVNDPSGWIYIRPEQTPEISVHKVFDSGNPSGKSYFCDKSSTINRFSDHIRNSRIELGTSFLENLFRDLCKCLRFTKLDRSIPFRIGSDYHI